MAVEANAMTAADFAKVSEVDFVEQFTEGVTKLLELLNVIRKVEKVPGQVVKAYKATGCESPRLRLGPYVSAPYMISAGGS